MSIVHKATLTPSKPEIFGAWLARQPWSADLGDEVSVIGSYRYDDPAGKVGIECSVLSVGASIVHLPASYRGAPLEDADDYLMATTEHSVLGRRWVYDACADPVAVKVLLGAALCGAAQETMEIHERGKVVGHREPTVTARGTGTWKPAATPHRVDGVTIRTLGADAVVEAAGFAITIKRVVDGTVAPGDDAALDVTWPEGSGRLLGVRHLS